MDEQYDVILLGTGLKECILSGLLSVHGYKVLHMDRNDYYGGECSSLNLKKLYEKFRSAAPPAALGESRDYNIDLVPKLIMADGLLVKTLLLTGVTRYLEFKFVDGSYVYHDGEVQKVPATSAEAISSSLMGIFEKRRMKNMLQYVNEFDPTNQKTYDGKNPMKQTMAEIFKEYDLDGSTQEFIGHALALHTDDKYLTRPAIETFQRIQLYVNSMARFEGGTSPYMYPLYGLGELPQAFARLSAIFSGTYMLRKPVDEIIYEGGKAVGVRSEGEVARCKFVVGDPSYFSDKVRKTGQVVRAICFLSHPVPKTGNAPSTQIIIPQKQVGRRSDIYVCVIGNNHSVAPAGKYVAIASTTVETSDPARELDPAFKILGAIDDKIITVVDTFEPLADGKADNVFISKTYDATSHFETTVVDVLDMWQRMTGSPLDLNKKPDAVVKMEALSQ